MKYILIFGLLLVVLIQIEKTGAVQKFFADAVTPEKIDPSSPAARARLSKYSWSSRAQQAIGLPRNAAAVVVFNDSKKPVVITVTRSKPERAMVKKLSVPPGGRYCSLILPATGSILIEVVGARDIEAPIRPNEYVGWVFTDDD